MALSIVVVTETADHEFPSLDEAYAFLHNMGYAQDGEPVLEAADGGTVMLTEYERDQVSMEYDPNSHAQLSAFSPAADSIVIRTPGRINEPTVAMPLEQEPYQFELQF